MQKNRGVSKSFPAVLLCLVILIVGLALSDDGSGQAADAADLSEYVAPNKMYTLYKPADWKVIEKVGPDSYRVEVTSPDGTSLVVFYWARNATQDSSALARFQRVLRNDYPDASIDKAWTTSDQTRVAADVSLLESGTKMKGRYYVETSDAGINMQGYATPEKVLSSQRQVLLNIMASMAFLRKPPQGGDAAPTPIRITLVTRQAPDGSLTIKLPQDWDFLAAQGRIVAGAPGGGMGILFTTFSGNPMIPNASVTQGVIGSAYLTPAETIPVLLIGFGHSNPEVTSGTQDTETMAAYQTTFGRSCDAADLSATWTSSGSVNCMGVFKVINALPVVMGQWSSMVMGIWGPQTDFLRYVPLLEQVADSYSLNDAFVQSYIRSGLANLRRLQQQTAASIRSLNDARADNQTAWEARQERKDYMDSKWDDYRRGNSYWVSDIEGGKIYRSDAFGTQDTMNGDYYEGSGYTWTNFEGQNPRYPSEDMREVSSYEMEHGQPPR